jgi:acetoin:2,6-dichlorophenolindophenol oxidoreductase subunit alpha
MMEELSNETKMEMLKRMLRIRIFDEVASELQTKGDVPGPMHTSIGQEAEVVGACMALSNKDYMTGNHRSHGHPIGKGAALKPLMAELLGKETGVCKGRGGSMHLADFSVGSLGESGIVGAGMPIATGAALSAKLRGTDQVGLTFFGDGASNAGPFHEALNLASIWKLPVIFLCENNGYAVTTRATDVVPVKNISDRAAAYNVPGEVVDGQDILAVYEATSRAVKRARSGAGPTLLDVKTYRYRDHAEFGRMGDSVGSYRTREEVEAARLRDPIDMFAKVLMDTGVLTEHGVEAIRKEIAKEVDEAVEFAKSSAYPDVSTAYDFLFVETVAPRH